jgi:hypothetical protein
MRFSSVQLIAAALVILVASTVCASSPEEFTASTTLAKIDAAEESGVLTHDEAALNKIYYMFDGSRVDERFLVEEEPPSKCGTFLIHSIMTDPDVGVEVKAELQEFLDAPFEGRATYISPSGHFRLTYYTTGPHAVPSADGNSNGIPDRVELCAEYMDTSWQVEIDDLGFRAPGLFGGYYQVGFESMSGIYGYTQGYYGTTRIVLHNTFIGFPPNDDPDGDVLGAAKVTCAHEFKHASQYTTSHWTEGGWVELDATWAEEIVYPLTNDYHTYLQAPGSPLSSPQLSLDDGGSGSYEDCIWEQFMSEVFGDQIIVDLWEFRAGHTGWTMLNSYEHVLNEHACSCAELMGLWTRWNYLTGAWHVDGYGYPDAPDLRTCSIWLNVSGLGIERTYNVPHLACRYARHHSTSGLPDNPKLVFEGAVGVDWRPQFIIKKTDGTVEFDKVDVDMGTGHGEKTLDIPFSEISELGLAFPNTDWSGGSKTFSYQLFSAEGTGVEGELYGDMRLFPAYPNPFNPKTTIRFQLSSSKPVDLVVVAPGGRVVRRLVAGEIYGGGEHEIVFDGKDNAGNDLPSGIYFAKLSVGGSNEQLAKMTLLK